MCKNCEKYVFVKFTSSDMRKRAQKELFRMGFKWEPVTYPPHKPLVPTKEGWHMMLNTQNRTMKFIPYGPVKFQIWDDVKVGQLVLPFNEIYDEDCECEVSRPVHDFSMDKKSLEDSINYAINQRHQWIEQRKSQIEILVDLRRDLLRTKLKTREDVEYFRDKLLMVTR